MANFKVIPMTIRIKELLKEKGISQKDLADRLGITVVGISKILNGNPKIDTLEKIASTLEIELWELFVDEATIVKRSPASHVCPHCGKPLTIRIE